MRILVYSIVDQREPGGVQMVIAGLVEALRARGHRVTQGLNEPGASVDNRFWRCPLFLRPAEQRGGSRREIHLPSLMRALAGLLRLRPAIVNIHFVTRIDAYFFLLRRILRYKIVLSVHGSDLLRTRPEDREALFRHLGQADAVTVVSEDLRMRVLRVPGVRASRVHLIPNGIDCAFWSPRSAQLPDATGARFVAIGRLEPVKGFDILLEAFASLRKAAPAARLSIIGEGPERTKLVRLARSLGVGDTVEFTGALAKEEVRERLRSADACVMSSRNEGMPLALLEAMACGLPCIATRVGGIPKLLGECGKLVAPDDPQALADGMMMLLEDPSIARRLGAAAHDRAQSFSREASEAAYEGLFREVLDESREKEGAATAGSTVL